MRGKHICTYTILTNFPKPFPKSVSGLCLVFYFHQIHTVTDCRGNREGARELLSRLVQKKDWFSRFLIALRETQHGGLADDLSGNIGGNNLISLALICGAFLISPFRSVTQETMQGSPRIEFTVTLRLMLLLVWGFQDQVIRSLFD